MKNKKRKRSMPVPWSEGATPSIETYSDHVVELFMLVKNAKAHPEKFSGDPSCTTIDGKRVKMLDEETQRMVDASCEAAMENGYDQLSLSPEEIAVDIGTCDSDLEGRDDLAPYVEDWQRRRRQRDSSAASASL